MVINEVLNGEKIILRCCKVSDCTDKYVEWLNDPEVNQFLGIKWYRQTIQSVITYVEQMQRSDDNILLAIIDKESDIHIGNIKIGPIDINNYNSSISYFIGEKKYWGKGIATEAVHLVTKYLFSNMNIHKIWAGYYSQNKGSKCVLKNVGYIEEGQQREHCYLSKGCWDDYIYVGLLKKNYAANNNHLIRNGM